MQIWIDDLIDCPTRYENKKEWKEGLIEAGKKKAKETYSKLKAKRKSKKRVR